MLKNIFYVVLLSITTIPLFAQRKPLKFNEDGKFKIIQFTDVHYKPGVPASEIAVDLIKEAIVAEKPDLVVFTGDLVWAAPAKTALDNVTAPVVESGTPWAYILGNHDDEFELSRQELIEYAMQKPYCLAEVGDKNLKGAGNYVLEVKKASDDSIGTILYFMDSGSYTPIKGVGKYDWFAFDQVDWYRKQSEAYTKENGGKPYNGLAFFHIPLAEYAIMKANDKSVIVGNKDEKECNGVLNSGMFTAMRIAGDVMGTFVGHDHNNDYIGTYYDIALAYGRYSGGKTVYNDLGLNGCRVIELEDGKREFNTYIRLLGGEKISPVKYPDTITPKKEEKKK